MDNIRAIGNRATSTSSYGGGVVYIDANVTTPVVVKNSYFESNIAYRGGSFFVSGSSTLNITNSVFRNGSTYNSRGGDVHVNGGQLTWTGGASYGSYENIDYSNTTQTLTLQGASGGSVSLLGGSASVSGIHFEGQRVAYYGAVFYCYGPANLSIDSITTNDTQSYQMGGLIYSLNTPNLTLTNSVITNPLAAQGSGVASNWGLLYMNNVTVYNSSTINVAAGFIGDGPGANTTLVNVNVYGSRTINQSTIDNNGVGGGECSMYTDPHLCQTLF